MLLSKPALSEPLLNLLHLLLLFRFNLRPLLLAHPFVPFLMSIMFVNVAVVHSQVSNNWVMLPNMQISVLNRFLLVRSVRKRFRLQAHNFMSALLLNGVPNLF